MFCFKVKVGICAALLTGSVIARAQQTQVAQTVQPIFDQHTIQILMDRLAADEARIKELESRLAHQGEPEESPVVNAPKPPESPEQANTAASLPRDSASPAQNPPSDLHDHMELPGGGPSLKLRGFLDLNAGVGSAANPLAFPLNAPAHATFQLGQFDLFISSKLSEKLSFISEIAIGSSTSNAWDLDIERMQLTYHPSEYFEISGGRYHTAIGYYNTAFHHGAWFQTATGRPFMYYFEDNGGLLPVHSVGLSMSGLVPGTQRWGLHWIAETTNGRASDSAKEPVQNFLADKDSKGYNLAAYIAPEWARGLQIGGSYYHDRLNPPGIPHVEQNIKSLYAVYTAPTWELLNEGVLLDNRIVGQSHVSRTPMIYSQVSRKFGAYRPYFRYQYVNSPVNDPVNRYLGRMMGPSLGLRWDVSDYAAFKLQYNRFDQLNLRPSNGLDAQMAFTF
jgi:hypothetical protein